MSCVYAAVLAALVTPGGVLVKLTRPFCFFARTRGRVLWLCSHWYTVRLLFVVVVVGVVLSGARSAGRYGHHLDAVVVCHHARQLEPRHRQRLRRVHGHLPVATGVPGGPVGHARRRHRRRRHRAATASPRGASVKRGRPGARAEHAARAGVWRSAPASRRARGAQCRTRVPNHCSLRACLVLPGEPLFFFLSDVCSLCVP